MSWEYQREIHPKFPYNILYNESGFHTRAPRNMCPCARGKVHTIEGYKYSGIPQHKDVYTPL